VVLKVSARGANVPSFQALKILAEARALAARGGEICHLEAGQPSRGAPKHVIEAAKVALDQHPMGYTEACGLPQLRDAIAAYYGTRYGLTVAPSHVVATTGSSGAFIMSFLAAFDVGDKVAMAAPAYPAYRNILLALGLVPIELPSTAEENYQPTLARLEALPEAPAGLIVTSPANPTGSMLGNDEMKILSEYCEKRGIRLVSDEIYHGITYGRDGVSALQYSKSAIVINSFSKFFSLTGWRLGWMVVPEDLREVTTALAQNLFISPPTLAQYVGIASLQDTSEVESYVVEYKKNRDLLLAELPKLGFGPLSKAEGGFYIYADVAPLTNDSEAFCRQLLNDTGVAMTPGADFDPIRGHRYVRISFAGSHESIVRAVEKLKEWKR